MVRTARSSAADRPPHRRSWSPPSWRTSSASRRNSTTPADNAPGCAIQPSSCQRTRSTIAPADNPRARNHTRSLRSPWSLSAVTTRRVHTNPLRASSAVSSSASCLPTKASGCSCSTGSSKTRSARRCCGGSVAVDGRSSSPDAKRWASSPGGPKRSATSTLGSSATAPSVERPRRANRLTSSASTSPVSCNQATGWGARKAAEARGAITIVRVGVVTASRAATAEANRPSAMPMPNPVRSSLRSRPLEAWPIVATMRSPRRSSPPK